MAGLLLCQKIVQLCQENYGCRQDADFPYMMLLNYPFADMLAADQSSAQKNLIRTQLEECFDTFTSRGIALGAIACNTLHTYLDVPPSFEIVHIMEETRRKLAEENVQRSLVLCSSTSANSLIHQGYLNCSYPPAKWQKKVDAIIARILAGKETVMEVNQLMELVQAIGASSIRQKGESLGIVLGCTEFSVLNEKWPLSAYGLDQSWTVIDSTLALAEGLCRKIFNKTN